MSDVKSESITQAPPPAYEGSGSAPAHAPAAAAESHPGAPTPINHEAINEPPRPEQARMTYERADPSHQPQNNKQQHVVRMVTPLSRLGDTPTDVDCPYCGQTTTTRVDMQSSGMTIVAGVVIGLFCICLACVPCCMNACAEVDHYCSRCNRQLTHRPYEGQVNVVVPHHPQDGGVPSQYNNNSAPANPQPKT